MTQYQIIENPDVDEFLSKLPNTLYKYLDWSKPYNQRVIDANELFFSSPRNFNDPFDCRIEKRYDLLDERETHDYFYNIAKLQSETYNLNWNSERIKNEAERLVSENNLSDLERMKENNEYLFSQSDNFYAVFCTSSCWDSIPMWAYYANNHKGICVGFDTKAIYLSGNSRGGLVTYDEYPVVKPNTGFHEMAHKQTYYKAKDWAHEKEFRLMTVRMPKHQDNELLDDSGKLKGIKVIADDSWYKEILLGVNMTYDDISYIVDVCKNKIRKGTKIYRLEKSRFEFKLEKREIDYSQF